MQLTKTQKTKVASFAAKNGLSFDGALKRLIFMGVDHLEKAAPCAKKTSTQAATRAGGVDHRFAYINAASRVGVVHQSTPMTRGVSMPSSLWDVIDEQSDKVARGNRSAWITAACFDAIERCAQ